MAKQYSEDFGNYIEDLNIYSEFERHLTNNSTILDLGAGSGRSLAYFKNKGYSVIGFDFSEKMKDYSYKLHGELSYIIDDMINLKKYFENCSIDGVFAMYSLFHLPTEDFEKVISDVFDILKSNGIFLLSYQKGSGEIMTDEPYLKDNGKGVLYMNYHASEEVNSILNKYCFEVLFNFSK